MAVRDEIELRALDPREQREALDRRVEGRRLRELQLPRPQRGEDHPRSVPVDGGRHQQPDDEEDAPEPRAAIHQPRAKSPPAKAP